MEVEKEIVDFGEVGDALHQRHLDPSGVVHQIPTEHPAHCNKDEDGGNLDAEVGDPAVRDEDERRYHDGPGGDCRDAGDDSKAARKAGDGRSHSQTDEVGRATEAGDLHHGRDHGDLEEQRHHRPPTAAGRGNGVECPPQRIGTEHRCGQLGARTDVFADTDGDRHQERAPPQAGKGRAEPRGHIGRIGYIRLGTPPRDEARPHPQRDSSR